MFYRSSKFSARKTEFNGRVYDSAAESGLAQKIQTLERAGKIKAVDYQKVFPLYGKNGAEICKHKVDFLITLPDGSQEVWEYKGHQLPDWKIKRKLFRDNYPEILYLIEGTSTKKGTVSELHLSKIK